jgi:chromosome segregation ATPase
MSIETTIDQIVEKGSQVNQRLDEKIKALEQHNNAFRTTLITKLQTINQAIDNFKQTNLQGLTETKNDLEEARRQLQDTQEELTRTRAELDDVRRQFADINNRLMATNEEKTTLDAKIAQLEQIVRDMETECNNKIIGVRKEMADKSTQQKKQMVQEQEEIKRASDAQIAELNKNIEELRQQSQDAQRGQENANNELRTLQENQQRLLEKLETVNQVLESQLSMIDQNINLNNPNYGDYEVLLDTIQFGLSGVMDGINSAVS